MPEEEEKQGRQGESDEPQRYTNVKVPTDLINEVEKVIRERRLGYRSRAEFVIEAVRERLLQIRETQTRS